MSDYLADECHFIVGHPENNIKYNDLHTFLMRETFYDFFFFSSASPQSSSSFSSRSVLQMTGVGADQLRVLIDTNDRTGLKKMAERHNITVNQLIEWVSNTTVVPHGRRKKRATKATISCAGTPSTTIFLD